MDNEKKRKFGGGDFWLMRYRLKKAILPTKITSDEYKKYLSLRGIEIGKGTHFFDPMTTTIDIQRPWMLHVGEYCKVTQNVTILCHDYSRSVIRRKYGEVIGEAKQTYIGDNVFIGLNSVICMGAHIGNNVIIGAGSIVTGNVPNDTVAAGCPARVICSLADYYKKRKDHYVEEAKEYVKCYFDKYNRTPSEREMGPFFPLFMERDREELKKKKIFTHLSGDNEEEVINGFLATESIYPNFQSFLDEAMEDKSE